MTTLRSRNTKIGKAALFAALTSSFAIAAFAQEAAPAAEAKSDDKEAVKLEKYEVTGSRIKRIDAETVSPVTEIKMDDIKATGFTNLGDVLRTLPMNSGQALTPTDSGTSFTPGVSTINLRGLGNNNTLVLINGRRAVPYAAPGFNGFQTMFDLNSIPADAIESVEILKDGGSAIYGSDAVGGVVNVKLKRDFQGLSTSATIGNFFNTDGFFKKVTATMGTSNAKTSITANMSWEEQNAVFARDVPWTANADNRTDGSGLQANPRYTVTGYDLAGFSNVADYLADVGLTNPVSDGYIGDNRSSRGYPGYVIVGGKRYSYSAPTNTPTLANAVLGGRHLNNFQESNGLLPSYRAYSFYTQARHDFSSSLYAFAEVSMTRNEYQVYSAATPVDIETSNGLDYKSKMFIPSYNPFNPWGVDIYSGRRRMVENGPRISDLTSDTPRIVAGLGGEIPEFGSFQDWTWEVGANYSKSSVNDLNRGTLPDYRLQQALMGLTRLGDGSMVWDPSTPQNKRVYFNWFGLNDAEMAKFLEVENPDSSSLQYSAFDFKTGGTVFELPAGKVGVAFGGEHRKEKMAVVVSDLNATGNVLGGSEGTSSFGSRSVTSIYAEADVPLLKNLPGVDILEAQFAGRFEDYSDNGFAKTLRPKVGIKYKPAKWFSLRASYSKAFKAPDLAYLYTASRTTFSSSKVYDPVLKTDIDQLQTVVSGNPDLKPETTDIYFAGVSFEPTGKLEGLRINIDWFRYEQKNLLAQLSDTYGYADFLTEAYEGNPLFDGKVVRDASTNQVLFIRDDYVNISSGSYKGVDVDIEYLLKTSALGHFKFGVNSTIIDETEVDGSDQVGGYLTPRLNATSSVGWFKGDWAVNTYARYYGKRERNIALGSGFDAGDEIYATYTLDPRITLNANISYKGFANTSITFGVTNLMNQAPAMDPMDQNGGTPGVAWISPAFWTLSVERRF